MQLVQKLTPLLALLLLSACVSTPVAPKPDTYVKPALNLADPVPVTLPPVNWKVVTSTTAQSVFNSLKSANQQPAIIGLNTGDFQNLTISIQKLNEYIKQLKIINQSYKDYYEPKNPPASVTAPVTVPKK